MFLQSHVCIYFIMTNRLQALLLNFWVAYHWNGVQARRYIGIGKSLNPAGLWPLRSGAEYLSWCSSENLRSSTEPERTWNTGEEHTGKPKIMRHILRWHCSALLASSHAQSACVWSRRKSLCVLNSGFAALMMACFTKANGAGEV